MQDPATQGVLRRLARIRRHAEYIVARAKLAFGRTAAALIDLVILEAGWVPALTRIGTEYGGWHCCPGLLASGRTAMCCGAGEDISFDIALNAKWGMRVICVDPTPRAIHHVESLLLAHGQGRQMAIDGGPDAYEMSGFRREDFMLIQRAIWSSDGVIDLYAPRNAEFVSFSALNLQQTDKRIQVPASRISTILNERGETQLALLKLDIEGAEYEVLRSMLASGIFPAQLLVEFDQVNQPLSPLFWVDLLHTSRELKRAGYQLVHRERANYLFVLRAALES